MTFKTEHLTYRTKLLIIKRICHVHTSIMHYWSATSQKARKAESNPARNRLITRAFPSLVSGIFCSFPDYWLFWILKSLVKICFFHIVINRAKMLRYKKAPSLSAALTWPYSLLHHRYLIKTQHRRCSPKILFWCIRKFLKLVPQENNIRKQ